jgi:hypothetical protein
MLRAFASVFTKQLEAAIQHDSHSQSIKSYTNRQSVALPRTLVVPVLAAFRASTDHAMCVTRPKSIKKVARGTAGSAGNISDLSAAIGLSVSFPGDEDLIQRSQSEIR